MLPQQSGHPKATSYATFLHEAINTKSFLSEHIEDSQELDIRKDKSSQSCARSELF